ncbi:MAG: NAD-dependent epimerase/dehydratase family protein [Planctomycetes bacterium]|nr:NAD-dependent epimerase/dehydratase family protein [Planctomycetota bacterium]
MKILLAGGCGFVGAAICRRLLAARTGVSITVIDSLRRRGSETNVADLEARGVRVVHGDVRLAADIDPLGPVDWVIDAAAEPSVLAGTAAGGHTGRRQLVDHNLLGTVNLLEAAARWQAGVVLLSTSRVYAIPALAALPMVKRAGRGAACFALDETRPLPPGVSAAGIREDFPAGPPCSLYGATKLAGETLAGEYANAAGTPLVIDRCGVLAGAGQFGRADQGIFSWWIHRWAARRPLATIGFGGRGLQVRDCLHPDDLADLLVMQMAAVRPGAPELVNAAGGAAAATSLAELSAWCAARFGHHDVGASTEIRPYDLPWVVLDHSAATARHGWRPARNAPSIFEEIADHAERHPGWLDRCDG